MGLTFTQVHGNSNALASTWTTQNLTPGSLVLAVLFIQSATSDVSGISDGTNSWGTVVPIFRNSAGFGVAIWVASNSLATKPTVTASLTGSSSFNAIAILEYTNPNASVFDVTISTAYASSGSAQSIPTGPLSTNYTNETLIGVCVANAGSANFTGDSNFTQRGSGVVPASMFIEDQAISAIGSYSFSPTQTSTGAASSTRLIALKSTSSNPAPTPTTVWSPIDSRQAVPGFGPGPNAFRTVQSSNIYDVQTSSNFSVPGIDSRIFKPLDCRIFPNIPQNSRVVQV